MKEDTKNQITMKFISKINALFKVQKIKDAPGAEVWIVSWDTVYSYFSMFEKGKRIAKAFLMKEDAEAFAQSLRDAQKLLQNTNDINITIEKQS
jgi:hypothetical protein